MNNIIIHLFIDGTKITDAATVSAVHSSRMPTAAEAETPSPQPSTSSRRPTPSAHNVRKATVPVKRKQIGEIAAVIKMRRVEHKTKMQNYKREREMLEDQHQIKMEVLQLKLRYRKIKLNKLLEETSSHQ